MARYERVTEKAITAFLNKDKEPGSKKPNWSNGTVNISKNVTPGRYSVGVWEWPDSGNLSVDIQKIVEDNDTVTDTDGEFD